MAEWDIDFKYLKNKKPNQNLKHYVHSNKHLNERINNVRFLRLYSTIYKYVSI